MSTEQAHRLVLERLAQILSGRLDLSEGESVMHSDAVLHMDRYTFHGRDAWRCWIQFIRSRPGQADLEISCDRMDLLADGRVKAYGSWRATVRGRAVVSPEATATYRFREGKIAEVWTTRANYQIMFGPMIRTHAGLLLVFLQLSLWCKLPWRGSDRAPAVPAIGPRELRRSRP
jgi:hypothetical protein